MNCRLPVTKSHRLGRLKSHLPVELFMFLLQFFQFSPPKFKIAFVLKLFDGSNYSLDLSLTRWRFACFNHLDRHQHELCYFFPTLKIWSFKAFFHFFFYPCDVSEVNMCKVWHLTSSLRSIVCFLVDIPLTLETSKNRISTGFNQNYVVVILIL